MRGDETQKSIRHEEYGVVTDTEIYRSRFSAEEMGGRNELWKILCREWFPKFIPADAVTLDLGAGACEFINNIEAKEKLAIDHNEDLLGYANADVKCFVAELDKGLAELSEGSVDRIMVSNVFEHLPNREYLFTCLNECRRVLVSGGKIVIMQPNIAVVKERFYDFADHTLPLTDKGMVEAVGAAGFCIDYRRARFLPYTTKSRYPKWGWAVRLYLKVPLAHFFMGGQMLIVGRKP